MLLQSAGGTNSGLETLIVPLPAPLTANSNLIYVGIVKNTHAIASITVTDNFGTVETNFQLDSLNGSPLSLGFLGALDTAAHSGACSVTLSISHTAGNVPELYLAVLEYGDSHLLEDQVAFPLAGATGPAVTTNPAAANQQPPPFPQLAVAWSFDLTGPAPFTVDSGFTIEQQISNSGTLAVADLFDIPNGSYSATFSGAGAADVLSATIGTIFSTIIPPPPAVPGDVIGTFTSVGRPGRIFGGTK